MLYAGACEPLTASTAFLLASDLLQNTAKTINEDAITVKDVRLITNEPRILQNFEEMLGFWSGDKEHTMKKLHTAKSQLITFEKESSQLVHLMRRWHGHIEATRESKWCSCPRYAMYHVNIAALLRFPQVLYFINSLSGYLYNKVGHAQ